MATEEATPSRPFFKPLPEHDTLNVAHFLARMSEKISVQGECWVWMGCKNRDGYGSVGTRDSRTELVHRVIYRLCVGEIPVRTEVCHNCPAGDNPACCNPAHLFLGSHADSMRDAARKGRMRTRDSKGEKNPSARLTEEAVKAIRGRFASSGRARGDVLALVNEFGVSAATVYRVINGSIWKHVNKS